jgi:hypothetical protein
MVTAAHAYQLVMHLALVPKGEAEGLDCKTFTMDTTRRKVLGARECSAAHVGQANFS